LKEQKLFQPFFLKGATPMTTTSLIKINTDSNNRTTTSSLDVAEKFEKNHKHVLRDIRSLDCSKDFFESNFELKEYKARKGKGKGYLASMPYFEITRDGFTFLVMGYTGKKAARFKEAYIREFNRMEEYIRRNQKQTLTMSEDELIKKAVAIAERVLEEKQAEYKIARQKEVKQIRYQF
jgi:Rha family phage regulatory protein